MSTQRVPAGVPTGGQFAPAIHAEADVQLDEDDTVAPDTFEQTWQAVENGNRIMFRGDNGQTVTFDLEHDVVSRAREPWTLIDFATETGSPEAHELVLTVTPDSENASVNVTGEWRTGRDVRYGPIPEDVEAGLAFTFSVGRGLDGRTGIPGEFDIAEVVHEIGPTLTALANGHRVHWDSTNNRFVGALNDNAAAALDAAKTFAAGARTTYTVTDANSWLSGAYVDAEEQESLVELLTTKTVTDAADDIVRDAAECGFAVDPVDTEHFLNEWKRSNLEPNTRSA